MNEYEKIRDGIATYLATWDPQGRALFGGCLASAEWIMSQFFNMPKPTKQAPAPHDAAKEVSGSSDWVYLNNPTNRPTDAAGEEPVLPEGVTFANDGYVIKQFGGLPVRIDAGWLTPEQYAGIAKHAAYRQRLQDKRESAEVSDAMVYAAFKAELNCETFAAGTQAWEKMRRTIAAALEARKQ